MFNLTKEEENILRNIDTPVKIQTFLNKIPVNFDYRKDTCMSPRMVLKRWRCHCIEGAIFAALALKFHGRKPLIMHFKTTENDEDHVVAIFKENEKFGAISKTNHIVLRYREPIYNSLRELAMSFFHEYTDKNGDKSLRSYSELLDLSIFDKKGWMIDEKDLWYIDKYLDKIKHHDILTRSQIKGLRKADKIERKIWDLVEWKRGKGKVS